MSQIKIAFFDVDGTLLKFETKNLSEKIAETTFHGLPMMQSRFIVSLSRPFFQQWRICLRQFFHWAHYFYSAGK